MISAVRSSATSACSLLLNPPRRTADRLAPLVRRAPAPSACSLMIVPSRQSASNSSAANWSRCNSLSTRAKTRRRANTTLAETSRYCEQALGRADAGALGAARMSLVASALPWRLGDSDWSSARNGDPRPGLPALNKTAPSLRYTGLAPALQEKLVRRRYHERVAATGDAEHNRNAISAEISVLASRTVEDAARPVGRNHLNSVRARSSMRWRTWLREPAGRSTRRFLL